jgi:geranyl-CoA carboxylase alpha subunit
MSQSMRHNVRPFHKVLVANRGEIAVRVIRTAKAEGYSTVAVYSEAEPNAPHVQAADEAVCLGGSAVGESYLCADKVLNAAKMTGADAIHPGYGFLSENADFAERCQQAGICFIGPSSSAIQLMGSKRQSKIAMLQADVPCVPGYEGESQDNPTLIKEADRIGYPVMIKASAGGGGRGMRLAQSHDEMDAMLNTARSEAEKAFGSGELILEKAIISPRHIEIQVFADSHGNCVYLGERDCSIQRRHQKVVEEAPSPFVDPDLRQRMGKAAVEAAKACDYLGAGTVEFLVDSNKQFYFLEMNTRLQVEHPVTELVTGQDLVAWQLDVAAGQPLPLSQNEIEIQGHAIEVRLYAEDPANQFMPQTGQILYWKAAEGEGVRIDGGIDTGVVVTPHYDPMLAKVIAYGKDREQARRRLVKALNDTTLLGVTINASFLIAILSQQEFIQGEATTAFIEGPFAGNPTLKPAEPNAKIISLAACLLHQQVNGKTVSYSRPLSSWSNVETSPWPFKLRYQEILIETALKVKDHHFSLTELSVNGETGTELAEISVLHQSGNRVCFMYQSIRQYCDFLLDGNQLYLKLDGQYYHFEDLTHEAELSEEATGNGEVLASMDGAIVKLMAQPGDRVEKGQTLVILEAMKMEHPLKANANGVIEQLSVKEGDQVRIRQLLVRITPDE